MSAHASTTRDLRRGTAATEFAIAMPLLILAALGTADFGRAFHFREAVSNAARAGADVAASHGFTPFTRAAWEADIRAATIAELSNLPAFDEDDVDFELSVQNETSQLYTAIVEVTYPFRSIVRWPALPNGATIRERVAVQRFR